MDSFFSDKHVFVSGFSPEEFAIFLDTGIFGHKD